MSQPPATRLPLDADQFLLRPDMAFLNHGSFGACPRPVFAVYQDWQHKLEQQPVEFLGRRINDLLAAARAKLATFLGTQADNLVYVPNATYGVNIVARSLELGPGDEVLSTNHEYGACDRAWRFICRQRGATYINQSIELPLESAEAFIDQLWAGVTERTRVIFLSHITSPTALIFPIEPICRRARETGILTVIDGAHAPGQIDLAIEEIGADFYTGNCHKWMCAPKSAGLLYARPERQALLQPLIVSWGWESETPGPSPFIDYFEWRGTHDPAAYLSVPSAIDFMAARDWPAVRAACHDLLLEASHRIAALSGLPLISPDTTEWWRQMRTIPLPPCDLKVLKERMKVTLIHQPVYFCWHQYCCFYACHLLSINELARRLLLLVLQRSVCPRCRLYSPRIKTRHLSCCTQRVPGSEASLVHQPEILRSGCGRCLS